VPLPSLDGATLGFIYGPFGDRLAERAGPTLRRTTGCWVAPNLQS